MDLKLTIKTQWFNMIIFGVKTEEYRELNQYWAKRLLPYMSQARNVTIANNTVHFFNGGHFAKSLRNAKYRIINIRIGKGRTDWGAKPNKIYFIIELGSNLEKNNL